MSRILLADDSPHAQRMGERILREEGYEVVTVTDGNTALLRLSDVDPDVVFADVSLPSHSGYEICQRVKTNPNHRHVRVILTAGLLEPFDDAQAKEVNCDGILKKPFESSVVLETVKPLIAAALKDKSLNNVKNGSNREANAAVQEPGTGIKEDRPLPGPIAAAVPVPDPRVSNSLTAEQTPAPEIAPAPVRLTVPVPPPLNESVVYEPPARAVPVKVVGDLPPQEPAAVQNRNVPAGVDRERVRAAVILALDAALPDMIEKITDQILVALGN
jgi:CheY-like chemotaxis protein